MTKLERFLFKALRYNIWGSKMSKQAIQKCSDFLPTIENTFTFPLQGSQLSEFTEWKNLLTKSLKEIQSKDISYLESLAPSSKPDIDRIRKILFDVLRD